MSMTSIPANSPQITSVQVTSSGTSIPALTNLSPNVNVWSMQPSNIYGQSGAHSHGGSTGSKNIPAFIPIFDKDKGDYIDVPYWEFHRVYEDHLRLKALAEEFPAVKQARDHLTTVAKLHRED